LNPAAPLAELRPAPTEKVNLTGRSVSTLGSLAAHHEANGATIFWDTPDHRRDTTLRIYERYTGLLGQERYGLVDLVGRIWHYDSLEVSWIAER
jgi:hypothetical protein